MITRNLVILSAFLGFFISLSFASANVVVISPSNDTNHSTVAAVFNVSFANGTDITIAGDISQTTINASFYYNSSGTWTFAGNSSACSVSACWGTIDVTMITDGVFSINATLYNGTSEANVGASVLTHRVTFDDTPPIVFNGNITSPASGSNQSGNVVLNVSVADATSGVNSIFFNVTNSSGAQNATYTATREGTTSRYSVSINTSHFPDGSYNITVYANDSVGNLNNSALSKEIIFDNTDPSVTFSCSPTTVDEDDAITCSCSGTDSTSNVSTTSFTSSPSTSSIGTFSTSCTVTDFSGNSASSTVSYTVQEANGGASSGGSGGNSGTSTTTESSQWTSTYPYFAIELNKRPPLTRNLNEMQRVEVKIENERHFVGVLEVDNDTVKIEVSSNPQEAILEIGETKKFEVTGDNFYDLQVSLSGISGGSANVTIEGISEEVIEETIAANASETSGAEENFSGIEGSSSSKIGTVVIFVIIVLGVGLFLGYKKFFKRKKGLAKRIKIGLHSSTIKVV